MNDTNVVCACNRVNVAAVNEYLNNDENKGKEEEVMLKECNIGTRCKQCFAVGCKKIDTHYSELIK